MDYLPYGLWAILLFFIIRRMFPVKGVKHITVAELKENLHDKNKQYIDVRTSAEFKGRNIKGFKNIPLHLLYEAHGLLKEKKVVLICQSGMRSNKASKVLKKQGFKKITNVKGGMNAWS
ncbi:rhodanese-like domain-containing protein [Bacillus weihaiensis]|uniref:Rhodanese n=1 Tax=Bacillus weihaiensis TaxID=1547283 RepID=A0A1L3MMS4_9BACI|nr:rhodanese-like domain-containing protein [Bacillus weihaiensis]APH03612.1 rhodanese [Bacillus weihaiensis]